MRASSLCLLSILVLQGCIFSQTEKSLNTSDASQDTPMDTTPTDNTPDVSSPCGLDNQDDGICCGTTILSAEAIDAGDQCCGDEILSAPEFLDGYECCDDEIVDSAFDENNCGGCGNACIGELACNFGACGCYDADFDEDAQIPSVLKQDKPLTFMGNEVRVEQNAQVKILPYLLLDEPAAMIFVIDGSNLTTYLVREDGEVLGAMEEVMNNYIPEHTHIVNFGSDYIMSGVLRNNRQKMTLTRVRYKLTQNGGLERTASATPVYESSVGALEVTTTEEIVATAMSHDVEGPLMNNSFGCLTRAVLTKRGDKQTDGKLLLNARCYVPEANITLTAENDRLINIDGSNGLKTSGHIRIINPTEQMEDPEAVSVVELVVGYKDTNNSIVLAQNKKFINSTGFETRPPDSTGNALQDSGATKGAEDIHLSNTLKRNLGTFLDNDGFLRSALIEGNGEGAALINQPMLSHSLLNKLIGPNAFNTKTNSDPVEHWSWVFATEPEGTRGVIFTHTGEPDLPNNNDQPSPFGQCVSSQNEYVRVFTSRFGKKAEGPAGTSQQISANFLTVALTENGDAHILLSDDSP